MKIVLICPSNMLYMPYVKNYEQILIEQNIDYDIINWDRFQIEEIDENTYRDEKKGHQRNFLDYIKYKNFLLNKLNVSHYDKIIVFGIQLSYFLKNLLIKNYKGKYVIDIRDHNKILNFFNLNPLIEGSAFTVISSPGYTKWLPKSNKYVINHNTQISSINELKETSKFNQEEISISYIGALCELKINTIFINSLKNNLRVKLNYHGEGDINKDIKSYIKKNEIRNVYITGRYIKKDEEKLYENSDFINVLRTSKGINNKTALPNRLYNAILYGKPLLSFKGSYLAEVVSKYNLGIVISSFNDIEQNLLEYIQQFDYERFNKDREHFLTKIIHDNAVFEQKMGTFLASHLPVRNEYDQKSLV